MTAALIHAPGDGTWGYGRRPGHVSASVWLQAPAPSTEEGLAGLVERYLGAFAPASIADIGRWSGIARGDLRPAVERLRDRIVRLRNIPHAIWNAGDTPARILEILSPGGFERYFEELGPVLEAGGDPEYYALAERYGITIEDDWVQDLEERHGVKL